MSKLSKLVFSLLTFVVLNISAAWVADANPAVIYNNRTSFNAATMGRTVETFNGIADPSDYIFYGIGSSTTLSGVTFSAGPTNGLFVIDVGYDELYEIGAASGGGVLSSQSGQEPITLDIVLPRAYTAVGFDTGAFASAVVAVTLSNGETLSYTLTDNTGRFFGFTTGVGFTSLSLSMSGGEATFNIDDFTSGQALIPEPATVLLLGTGLAGIGGVIRRRRQAKAE